MTTAVDEKQNSLIVNRKMEHVTPRILAIHFSRFTIHG
jgi:hypothetical protein